MNKLSFKLASFLLGMTALTVVSSTESAMAQTPSSSSSYERSAPMPVDAPAETPVATIDDSLAINATPPVENSAPIYAPVQTVEPTATSVTTPNSLGTHLTSTLIPEQAETEPNSQQANVSNVNPYQADAQRLEVAATDSDQQTSPEATAGVSEEELPGAVSTSATHLTAQPESSSELGTFSGQTDTKVAQELETIDPGRATRGGRSYVGIGGALGLTGGTGIGQGGFLINSKIGLTRSISVRPSVIIGDSTDFLIPLTYDFYLESRDPFEPIPFAPFVGGGVAFSTDDENDIGFLLTGGADFPLSRQFIANATVNAGFFGDSTSVGISLGVGYVFSGF